VGRPQLRIGDTYTRFGRTFLSGGDVSGGNIQRGDALAGRVQYRQFYVAFRGEGAFVSESRFNGDVRRFKVVARRGVNEGAPARDVHRVERGQPHMAIDAAAF